MRLNRIRAFVLFAAVAAVAAPSSLAAEAKLQLKKGDHICYVGNTLADRMQHHAWLETYLHALHPEHNLVFRNLGFPGDEITTRPRSQNFGSPDQWLTKCEADVVFCFFGRNEALRGPAELDSFKKNLAGMIDDMRKQQYNGSSPPRLVIFSPIAQEDLKSPHLPDGTEQNKNLALYTEAMRQVCANKNAPFVDLFNLSKNLYAAAEKPLTLNGAHLLSHGNRAVAEAALPELLGPAAAEKIKKIGETELERLRQVVLNKNLNWFSRYRVVDGYNVYGGRSRLAWFGQSNYDVMQREMEVFDVKTANRDRRIWAVAAGGDLEVKDDNLPPLLKVKTNRPGKLPGGAHPYIGGKEGIEKMTVHKGMKVNLFASEEMFPELINPVQISVGPNGRLYVSVWPSYPHWKPTEPRMDKIIILPDENGDGVADRCIVFADKLNSITGFEFWNGGLLVAAPPEIWFLKDTDGDDRADLKIRMLQGVSSADTHHTANAMLVGPDGWLYWSRGVFHVTNMETPTKVFRSTKSGVYRFNPRTFEVEFHFPIGPNPHGDVFDRWGYQFANDGTSGTGSYINIGKGIGNKQWFKKRVRPVPATGILSSTHFPDELQNNFLICNAIGFLGVLQYEVKYNGADIAAEEVEPILYSSDPNFRPSDLEIGGDGALYVADWHNALIGHMQHNIRDPNRDRRHGRIYRVTYEGRPLEEVVKLKSKPIREVCQAFFSPTNNVRYRARLELTSREPQDIVKEVGQFAAGLDPKQASKQRDQAQALLESLWVFEEQRIVNMPLLKKVFQAEEPRVRAAAIRTLGHWAGRVEDWEETLLAAARDDSALVRAEALKAAVEFGGLTAAEVIFEAGVRPADPELDTVLKYARSKINADKIVQDAIASGKPLSKAAQLYALRNASVQDLLKMDRTEAVYLAILSRANVPKASLRESLQGLAKLRKESSLPLLLDLIEERDTEAGDGLAGLSELLLEQSPSDLALHRNRLRKLARSGKTAPARRLGYAAWITADGSALDAFVLAARSKEGLGDLLAAVPALPSEDLRRGMYEKVRPLLFDLPAGLEGEMGSSGPSQQGIVVDYFEPNPKDVAIETLEKLKPAASGVVPRIEMNVPQLKRRDAFALRFTGNLFVPQSGTYTFYLASDDGARLYLDGKLLINNDGLHGMVEKNAKVKLTAGSHPLVVTYFDNGGGDGLSVAWRGPGMRKKQPIPAERLTVAGGETLHDVAIRTLKHIPGHEVEKFRDLARLLQLGRHRTSAIRAIQEIPSEHWPQRLARTLVDNLMAYVSEIPASRRTTAAALDAMQLAKKLAAKLPAEQAAKIEQRLQNLDVRIIAIGTVPHRMIYDKERIAVQAGKPVEFRFSNTDNMPHNFSITQPGALEEIGKLAEATAQDPDAMARHYVPKSDKILLASRLLQPGESQSLAFEAPTEPGVYPYVCTYPGHWRRMYGALYVVENLEEYQADPLGYLANAKLPIKDELLKYNTRGREWKYEELVDEVKPLPPGRNFDVGKTIFRVASCVACHRLSGEGQQFGPELAKLDPPRKPEEILESILQPSKKIEEKFQTYTFVLESGDTVMGMIVEETPKAFMVIENPLTKAKPREVLKAEVDLKQKAAKSLMPEGLLNKLSREEILDLIGYVYARGDKKHKIYAGAGHENHKH